MPDKKLLNGPPVTRKKYTPAFKAECVRQVAARARQMELTRAQGISPALRRRGQLTVLKQAVPGIKHLCAELKRVKIERNRLEKAVTSCLL